MTCKKAARRVGELEQATKHVQAMAKVQEESVRQGDDRASGVQVGDKEAATQLKEVQRCARRVPPTSGETERSKMGWKVKRMPSHRRGSRTRM